MSLEQALADTDRTQYYRGHLESLLAAITEDGVNIKAYFAWSTFDMLLVVSPITH